MKEYRFHWQTWVGISLLLLLLVTILLPEVYAQDETGKSVSRFSFAKWALTVEENQELTEKQLQEEPLSEGTNVKVVLRIWGWLIYVPFLAAMVSIVFMIVRRRTLAGVLLTDGLLAIVCECIIHFKIFSMLWKEEKHPVAVFVIMIILSIIIMAYSILCMTVWKSEKIGYRERNQYDYVFQEKSLIWDRRQSAKENSVRKVGILKGIRGEYAGQSIEIQMGEEIILGRDPQYCMLIFRNSGVSRRQCGIRYDAVNGYYQAIDYSSSGTTLSDGTLLTTSEYTPLKPGTIIYIAKGSEELLLV